ncbi:MAG: hypothetical protein ABSE48_23145 [Verrucomicrobiota bacterium]|jgi:hypothetical protein
MKYPDGSTIQVGDLIWWDEGLCIGYVQAIAESKEEYASWGLDTPHIFVLNSHPFDPAIASGVAHDEACLKDEGIGLLKPQQRIEFEQATVKALGLVATGLDYSTYSVTTDVKNRQFTGWVFTFYKGRKELERIRIPAKHESNA